MNQTSRMKAYSLLAILLIASSLEFYGQTQGFETSIYLSDKLSDTSDISLGLEPYTALDQGSIITSRFGTLFNYKLIYKTKNGTKPLFKVQIGNNILFADTNVLVEKKTARLIENKALIRIGAWGVTLDFQFPVFSSFSQTENLSVSHLIKELAFHGLIDYNPGNNPDTLNLIVLSNGTAKDSIFNSIYLNTHKTLKPLSDFLYFIWNTNSPTMGVILEEILPTNKERQQNLLTINIEEFALETINNPFPKKPLPSVEGTNEQPGLVHYLKQPTDATYTIKFKKRIVYDPKRQVPEPITFYVNKDEKIFTYLLPDSLQPVWTAYPSDTIQFSKKTDSKKTRTISIERRIVPKEINVQNVRYSSKKEIPDNYNVLLKHFVSSRKNKPFKARGSSERLFVLRKPFKVLPGDSLFIKVYKPFSFNVTTSDTQPENYQWKNPTVTFDCLEKDAFTLHWVKMAPQEVYYIDLSDTYQRKPTLELMNEEVKKIKKQNSTCVFYISNLNDPVIVSEIGNVSTALRMISSLEPLPPEIGFDAEQLSQEVNSERGFVRYSFFLSDFTLKATGIKMISKFLLEEYNLIATGLNEDKLDNVLKAVNKDRKRALVRIYVHPPENMNKPDNNDIKYIEWKN